MATRPVSWYYVGEFNYPTVACYHAISADGSTVIVIGVTDSAEYKIWASGDDVLDITSYTHTTTLAYDFPSSANIFVSNDLDTIVIPLLSNDLLILKSGGSVASTYSLPSGYSANGWVTGSLNGEYVLLSGGNGDSVGFFFSEDFGVSWTFIETFNSLDGGYNPHYSCIDSTGQLVYSVGETPEADPTVQAYSSVGPGGVASNLEDITWYGVGACNSTTGSVIFVGVEDPYLSESPPAGLYKDPTGTLTLLLESGVEPLKFNVNSTGAVILAGIGNTSETATLRHSTDTGNSWFIGPSGIAPQWSTLGVASSGSRLGILSDVTGELWLTGLTSDQTGRLVLTGNTPVVDVSSVITLIGYVPEITAEPVDPTGVLRLIGYAPTVPIYTLTPMTGTLNLTGYLPIVIRDAAYHFVRTIFFSPTYGTPEAITVTVNYDDGTLLPIYSDSGLTQPIANPFSLNLTTLTIDFYVTDLSFYYNVVLTGGNLVGTVTIDENGG